MSTIVFYYTQKESGSDLQHPDCFTLKKGGKVTVKDVLDAFPLSRFGSYHIRFRRNTGDSYEWMEPQDVSIPCPTYNGGIFLKVLNIDKMIRNITRIPIEESIIQDSPSMADGGESMDEFSAEEESHGEEIDFTAVEQDNPVNDGEESVGDPSPSVNCSDDMESTLPVPPPKNVVIEEAPMNVQYVTRDDVDVADDACKLTGTSYEGKSATVIKAMKEREEKLREKQIKALMEKKEREIVSEVKEEEREKAKLKLGKALDEWAIDAAGEKKNIRTLLATMHTVLWEGANFTPISMSQVLLPERVKLFYRKAMLKVHPDKNQDGSPEQKYIAQRVFEALNQAWSRFQDEQNRSTTNFTVF